MLLKLIGSILIIGSCTLFGLTVRFSHRKTVKLLQQLMDAVQYMEHELAYRPVSLPELCKNAAKITNGSIAAFFLQLESELQMQILPEPRCCVQAAASKITDLPPAVRNMIDKLGATLGQFGIDGQVSGFHETVTYCKSFLNRYTEGENSRLRSYQTLAVCAGAALVILFL